MAGFFVLITSWITSAVYAQSGDNRSVRAIFVRQLDAPGESNELLRPAALHIDRSAGEILVAEGGHNRVVIFGLDGTYRYEFGGGGRFTLPVDLTVDSQGYILILAGSARARQVLVYDFDGAFVEELPRTGYGPEGEPIEASGMAVDGQDRIYLVDPQGLRVCVYGRDGAFLSSFPVLTEAEATDTAEPQLTGRMAISGDRLYLAAPATGAVFVYGLDGTSHGTIGHKGNNVGELNFPVDVAVADGGRVYILDKGRFNIVCFGSEGGFLGEFGGKGMNPGWFYHPSLLGADGEGRVCVGQVFQNKVQICAVPEFVLEGSGRAGVGPHSDQAPVPSGNGASGKSESIEGGGSSIEGEPVSCSS